MTNIKKEFCEEQIERNNKKKIFNLKNLNKILLLLIIVLGVYYLTGINDLTVKGFRLQEVKKKIGLLSGENKNIELKITGLESYNNLSERVRGLSMVAAGEIDYLVVLSGIVAKK